MSSRLQRRLGKAVRRLRHAQGLSQERFADLIGVHRTTMGRLERGDLNLTLETLERLAKGLGQRVSGLLLEAESETMSRRASADTAAKSQDDEANNQPNDERPRPAD